MTDDDVIVCDPEAEYTALVQKFEGQVIKISPSSTQYINPMDINANYSEAVSYTHLFGTGALSEDRMLEVGERDTLSLGLHRLRFLLAPMVHWPEVIDVYKRQGLCRGMRLSG